MEETGEPDTGRASVLAEWEGLPHFDLSTDAWLVHTESGEAVAYAEEWDERPHEWLLGHFAVFPDHRGRGLDGYLMELIERRARTHAAHTSGGTSKLGVYCVSTDARKTHLYRSRGYSHIRSFARLSRDLTGALPPPVWPAGIIVRPLRRGRDERAVHAALEEAFSEHFRGERLPFEEWERLIFADRNLDPDLWFVAWDGSQVAGTALAFSLEEPRYGYVDRLGVRARWRRRGLGEALLLQCFIALRERGQVRAVLGVDIDNVTGAQRLYERAGMRPERVTEFFEKEVGVLG